MPLLPILPFCLPPTGIFPHFLQAKGSTSPSGALIANVLSAAGISGFRVIPREQIPADLKSNDAVWVADGGLVGTVSIVSQQGASSTEQLASYLMASDAQSCKGVFASGRYPTQQQSGSARLRTACDNSDNKAIEIDYTIALRPQGGFYVFALVATGGSGGQSVQQAGARLHEATLVSLSRR
jgi:hypothetical protein